MDYNNNKSIILTLDAGGTNFVFSAMEAGNEIVKPVRLPSNGNNLELCLKSIINGFEQIIKELNKQVTAISFAFPGPADYRNGIIGDLKNLPAFRGGIPLGPILQEHFGIPVFINNDGDLFAYGEALGGMLPEVNNRLAQAGNSKRYHNLIGITLGTGFGCGIVRNEELFTGDNSIAAEVWIFSNRYHSEWFAEESVSARAIVNTYCNEAGITETSLYTPAIIYDIATGTMNGNKQAALNAFNELGRNLGDTLANLLTLIDGIAVIGGGLTGASKLYMAAVMNELKSNLTNRNGDMVPRLVQQIYNLDDESNYDAFLVNHAKGIQIPGKDKYVIYDPVPRLAVATSKLGASKAISLGAYTYALKQLNKF